MKIFISHVIFNMSEIEYSLGFKNLRDIPIEKYDKDFTFIVDDKKYSTPRFVADLISPKIRNFHFTDESINEFIITTDNDSNQEDHFTEFLDLFKHENIKIDITRQNLYSIYFLKLGNTDEYTKLSSIFSFPVTVDNAVSRLKQIRKIYQNEGQLFNQYDQNITDTISFISEHFSEIPSESFKEVSADDLDLILSNEALKISDEDSLLDFVVKKYSEDRRCSVLFSHVMFSNVSDMSLEKFINIFSIDDLDEATWSSICSRLLAGKDGCVSPGMERYATGLKCKEFKSEVGHEFDGIMHYLTEKSGGNIHDNGTIEITTNSFDRDYHPKNLVDYRNPNYYYSKMAWLYPFVCFDFKDRRVKLSEYSIKSCSFCQNACHLRNWVLEVSNDGSSWAQVDRHTEDPTLNGSGIVANFKLANASNDFFRFIKLRSTGFSWVNNPSEDSGIRLGLIEFFGQIAESS